MLQRVKCTHEKANKCSKFENCNCENLFFRTVEWSSRQRHSPRGLRVVDVGLVACHRARIGVLQTWVAVKCKRTTHMTVSSACDLLFDVRASIVLPRVLVGCRAQYTESIHSSSLARAHPTTAEHRNVSTAGLLLIAFFWVVGGVFGNEPLVVCTNLCVSLTAVAILHELAIAPPDDEISDPSPLVRSLLARDQLKGVLPFYTPIACTCRFFLRSTTVNKSHRGQPAHSITPHSAHKQLTRTHVTSSIVDSSPAARVSSTTRLTVGWATRIRLHGTGCMRIMLRTSDEFDLCRVGHCSPL